MQSRSLTFLGITLSFALIGCANSVDADPEEETLPDPGPQVEFDPGSGIIPLPSNLVFDVSTGTLDLPAGCNESASATAIREGILNTLDGFATFKAGASVTFTAEVDEDSLANRVWMFRVQRAGTPDDPTTAPAVPVVTLKSTTVRFDANCANPATINSLVVAPMMPLDDSATYAIVVLDGVTTGGTAFEANATWSLVRGAADPVVFDDNGVVTTNLTPFDPTVAEDLATLQGLEQLWTFHNTFLPFVDGALATTTGSAVPREDILAAWSFNTQTLERPLDPGADGPGGTVATATTNDTTPVPFQDGATPTDIIEGALCAPGTAPCGVCTQLPCADVGEILKGTITSPNYQVLAGPVPTVWDHPITPGKQSDAELPYVAFVPAATTPPDGFPVVIFGHGLTGSKLNLVAIASQLARAGIASIAIDHVAHGDRAVRISTDGTCAGDVDPGARPDCFAPFLSDNFAVARDNIRQSIVDQLKLIEVLKACGTTGCDGLPVDGDRIGYMGQSLGALIGVSTASLSDDIQAAVLNVGGVGWVDVATYSDEPGIICPVIDGLIAAGSLSGVTWNGKPAGDPETNFRPQDTSIEPALCGEEATFIGEPGFASFASTARWVYDAADGANFVDRLLASDTKALVQRVVGDTVVPNEATEQLGLLLGLTSSAANIATDPDAVTPTEAAAATANGWIDYSTDNANAFTHGSLLLPANDSTGALGTAQMQTDAITFLVTNL